MTHKIIVTLHLNGHCIETEAKNQLHKLSVLILNSDNVTSELENQYKLLYDFITIADFKALRSMDERLNGLIPLTCELIKDDEGKTQLKINGTNPFYVTIVEATHDNESR